MCGQWEFKRRIGDLDYQRRQHALVVDLELVFAGVLTCYAHEEIVLLYGYVFVAERAEPVLEFLGQQVVVTLSEIHLGIIEVIEEHHLDKCLCDVLASDFEIHACVFETKSFFDACD